MKTLMKRIIFTFTFLCLCVAPAFAQNYAVSDGYVSDNRAPVSDTFTAIKKDIARLLKENKRLENQFRKVQEQTDRARAAFNQKRKEADQLREQSHLALRERKNQEQTLKDTYGNLESLKNDILLKRSRISYLQGQILMLEEKQNLRETQLKDLKNQAAQAQVLSEKGKFNIEERINQQKLEVAALQKDIDRLNRIRDKYYEQYRLLQNPESTKAALDVIKTENDILRQQIAIIEKEKDLLYREHDNLQKQKKLRSRLSPQKSPYSQDYYKKLERDVKRMEEKYKNLNATLEGQFDRAEQYRQLNQEFVEASRKNHELRIKLRRLD